MFANDEISLQALFDVDFRGPRTMASMIECSETMTMYYSNLRQQLCGDFARSLTF